jgi:glutamine amidotransferase
LAHNGDLFRFAEMKFDLLEHIKPKLAQKIRGNTDSEWMYALTLSQLEDPLGDATPEQMGHAVAKMLAIIRKCRERLGIDISSPANLFLTNGHGLVAARFTFDYGCYPVDEPSRVHEMQLRYLSLWYTAGADYGFHDGEWKMRGGMKNAKSVMVASEPLTKDPTTWMEVPEYGLIHLDAERKLGSFEIDA